MKTINPDQIPLLDIHEIINDEAVSIGMTQWGVIIHYTTRDTGRLIEWSDMVDYGLADITRGKTKEITAPTKPD